FKEEEEEETDMELDDEIDEDEVWIILYHPVADDYEDLTPSGMMMDIYFLGRSVQGLNKKMNIWANTEFSTLKRLDKGHKFMKGLDEDLRNEM
nr:hypothetical protein [Tanacetum cinerariifolium]